MTGKTPKIKAAPFLSNLLNEQPSILYTYSDLPNGCSRDYLFCADVARAVLKAMSRGSCQVFNIGSGCDIYMRDLYQQLQSIVGRAEKLIVERERQGDVKRSFLDISKAKQMLSWEPQMSLSDGLKKTVEWAKSV